MSIPLGFRFYRAAGRLAAPLAPAFLDRRARRGKEVPERANERLGHPELVRPEGPLVWLHAASVGETNAVLPLIERLDDGTRRILLTTGTRTSAEIAAKRLPAAATHQFVPLDLPDAVTRFYAHWRPDLALFCESEIWPNLLLEAQARAVPAGIVNGRMSPRSHRGWRRAPGHARALMGGLALCLAQSEADAERYRDLGAPAAASGNLKFDSRPLPVDAGEAARFGAFAGDRQVLVIASTHPGEEALLLEALAPLRRARPHLLTVIAPRHPARGEALVAEWRAAGERVAQRSAGEVPEATDTLYLADTLGELGLFFARADLVVLGGSLVPIGGHNPIEPAQFGRAILTGPILHNFEAVFAAFRAAGAVRIEPDAASLAIRIGALLDDPAERARLGENARQLVADSTGALDRTLDALRPWLGGGR